MPAGVRGRLMAFVLLLIFAIAANGAPRVQNFSGSAVSGTTTSSSLHSDSATDFSSGLEQADDTCNPHLARIGKELLEPPATDWRALPPGARSLPGVPAAIFMVLTGFLCVSIVNDRRIWLASLAALLWLGQTGVSAMPKVASHIAGKRNITQNSPYNFVGVGKAKYHRLRSEMEGTQYMGLLRHLAGIPALVSSSIPVSISSLRTGPGVCDTSSNGAGRANFGIAEFAMAAASFDVTDLTACSACAAEYSVRFSPAFVFSNLARGPPQFD